MSPTLRFLSIAVVVALMAACGGETDDGETAAAAQNTAGEETPVVAEESGTDSEESEEPKEPKGDPQAVKELKGTYETSLTIKDVKKAGAIDLAIDGPYTIDIKSDGYIVPRNPKFEEAAGRNIQPATFTADGKTLTTELYSGFPECATVDPGTYGWELKDGSLSFVLKKDDCGLRKALFLTKPWTES